MPRAHGCRGLWEFYCRSVVHCLGHARSCALIQLLIVVFCSGVCASHCLLMLPAVYGPQF